MNFNKKIYAVKEALPCRCDRKTTFPKCL